MQLVSTHIVLNDDIGVRGNLYGGKLMAWIDDASSAYAREVIKNPNTLTLKVSECLFLKPSKLNNIIKLYCETLRIGITSITVKVEARRCDVTQGDEEVVCTTEVTLVQIDEDGRPCAIKK